MPARGHARGPPAAALVAAPARARPSAAPRARVVARRPPVRERRRRRPRATFRRSAHRRPRSRPPRASRVLASRRADAALATRSSRLARPPRTTTRRRTPRPPPRPRPAPSPPRSDPPRARGDLANVLARFRVVASPFWTDPKSAGPARALLGGVVALTLGATAISVGFNFLGRDFYNAIAEKQPDDFDRLLKAYILAIAGAILFFVARDYYQSVLTLRWRAWMTERYVEKYLSDRNSHIQTGSVIDNPDQRIVDDISSFTATSLGLAFTLLNAGIDLVGFSGILIGIYEPLVVVLFGVRRGRHPDQREAGQPLVGLNFHRRRRRRFRYGLVRVRENAESVAFYAGEAAERSMLVQKTSRVDNFGNLLIATRNVDFFTSCYRYLVTFLPPSSSRAVFKGEIGPTSSTRAPAPSRTSSATSASSSTRSSGSRASPR